MLRNLINAIPSYALALVVLVVTVSVLVSSCVKFRATSAGIGVDSEAQQNGKPVPLDFWKNEKLDRAREEFEKKRGSLDRPDINSEADL